MPSSKGRVRPPSTVKVPDIPPSQSQTTMPASPAYSNAPSGAQSPSAPSVMTEDEEDWEDYVKGACRAAGIAPVAHRRSPRRLPPRAHWRQVLRRALHRRPQARLGPLFDRLARPRRKVRRPSEAGHLLPPSRSIDGRLTIASHDAGSTATSPSRSSNPPRATPRRHWTRSSYCSV
jgi:hypothetical protein